MLDLGFIANFVTMVVDSLITLHEKYNVHISAAPKE